MRINPRHRVPILEYITLEAVPNLSFSLSIVLLAWFVLVEIFVSVAKIMSW